MPKPLKKRRKRPSDPILAAQELLAETEALAEEPGKIAPVADFKAYLSAYMAELGRKGGRRGGKRRLVTMTREERSAVALKAARSRWKKAKAAKRG